MKTLPKLSEARIRNQVGERSYSLGIRYFEDGAVFKQTLQGETLKAHCQGSADEPYRVWARLSDKGIAEAECSCPVGSGGHCKHVAALLLSWQKEPENFMEIEELEPALQARSKEELIALIKRMLEQEPDLEWLLELPLTEQAVAQAESSAEMYQKQAKAIFRRIGSGRGSVGGVVSDLQVIEDIGKRYLQNEDFVRAADVYLGLCSAICDHYDSMYDDFDEEGRLGGLLNDCSEILCQCLDHLPEDSSRRQAILKVFWEILQLDVEQGGVGIGDNSTEYLMEKTTPQERRKLIQWVEKEIESRKGEASSWSRDSYTGFLLDLQAEDLDDEAFLAFCRKHKRQGDLVRRLLQLERVEEAVKEIEKTTGFELVNYADLLVEHKQGEVAEQLVQKRAIHSKDRHLSDWLFKRAKDRKDWPRALELAERKFEEEPYNRQSMYFEIQTLANKLKCWDSLRPKLLAAFKKENDSDSLISIYLKEGKIDEALEELKKPKKWGVNFWLGLEVAKAAEKSHPQEAADIYKRHVQSLIDQRGRSSYQEACRHLKKIRSLYQKVEQDQEWDRYISQIREKNPSLRALQEELTKAKL